MAYQGSEFYHVNRRITLGCISPEARNLLDHIMDEWEKHKVERRKVTKKRTTIYGFAYWLIRWSGLVQPYGDGAPVINELAEALKLMSKRGFADGSLCWCNEPPFMSSAVHSSRCEAARAALAKATKD